MVITGWHGGWGRFTVVDPRQLGTGENDALGWGFYFAEHKAGGEKYARYAKFVHGTSYLHRVCVKVPRPCIWQDPEKQSWVAPDGSEISWEQYRWMRLSLGTDVAAAILRRQGVRVIAMASEADTSCHGCTYVALNVNAVRVTESYEWRVVDGRGDWRRIACRPVSGG